MSPSPEQANGECGGNGLQRSNEDNGARTEGVRPARLRAVIVTNRRKTQTPEFRHVCVFPSIRHDHARPALPAAGRTPSVAGIFRSSSVAPCLRVNPLSPSAPLPLSRYRQSEEPRRVFLHHSIEVVCADAFDAKRAGKRCEAVRRHRDAYLSHIRGQDDRASADLTNDGRDISGAVHRGPPELGNREAVYVDDLDERSEPGGLLHLRYRHLDGPAHRVGHNHVLGALRPPFPDEKEILLGRGMSGRKYELVLRNDADHFLHFWKERATA